VKKGRCFFGGMVSSNNAEEKEKAPIFERLCSSTNEQSRKLRVDEEGEGQVPLRGLLLYAKRRSRGLIDEVGIEHRNPWVHLRDESTEIGCLWRKGDVQLGFWDLTPEVHFNLEYDFGSRLGDDGCGHEEPPFAQHGISGL